VVASNIQQNCMTKLIHTYNIKCFAKKGKKGQKTLIPLIPKVLFKRFCVGYHLILGNHERQLCHCVRFIAKTI